MEIREYTAYNEAEILKLYSSRLHSVPGGNFNRGL